MDRPSTPRRQLSALAGYVLMLAAGLGAIVLVRRLGEGLRAPPPVVAPPGVAHGGASVASAHQGTLLHVLLALLVIVVVARLLGAAFRALRQPPVIGEVVAGLLLGPSLLGRVAPGASAFLLPPSVAPYLGVLSQVGVILYMFLVGLDLDGSRLRERGRATVAISHASIVVPFVLGTALSLLLYPRYSTSDVPFLVFALFIGVALSVTAFPVLARILTDRGIQRSHLGIVALTCAAVDDATAWCLLALVASLATAQAGSALLTVGLTLAYLAFVLIAVRPVVVRLVARRAGRQVTQGAVAAALVGLLLSALVTEAIGIHAIFGAFLLGAIVPHDSELAAGLRTRLEDLVSVLLLPAFFAFTGMRTQIGLVDGATEWLLCGLIIVVASVGKFGGSAIAARLTGLGWRESASLGVLMNTRGLMELVVLNLGLDLGILSSTVFAMMVLMALATTMATAPLLSLLTAREAEWQRAAEGARPA